MNTEVIRKDWVGLVIDESFTLVHKLGVSERGVVYLCECVADPSVKAAIKLIPADIAEAESRSAGWNAAAELSHPHLMRLLHTGRCQVEDAEMVYVATEYADEVLSEILPQRALTASEAREMLEPVVDALSYLHGKNLVHGDLKPANIMVVKDQLKLSVDTLFDVSIPGHHLPVPGAYDAPEWGTGTVSPAVDVWSLGATLVEALTQHPPTWSDESQSFPIISRSIPKPFAQIAEECLRPDPSQRCTLSEIKACLESGTPIPRRRSAKSESTPSGIRRAASLIVALVVVLAVAVTLAIRSYQKVASASRVEQPSSAAITSAPPQTPPQPPIVQESAPAPPPTEQAAAPSPAEPSGPAPSPTSAATPEVANTPPPVPVPAAVPAPAPTQAPIQEPHSATDATANGVVQKVLPDVPQKAIRTISGTVKVEIRVNVAPNGSVSDATIESQGPSQYFANFALNAAKAWRFTPQSDGQGASSVWTLEFLFRKSGVETTASEETR